ncbi:MAG TPA: sulfatase-like hydrolase/transferase, partial [Pyrinomonadaceae bacterium]|nr:sulfatase-like hydrolase/transferase [Pyrinomonadaceae bacterium]
MRRHTKRISILVLIAVAASCFGCSQQPAGPTASNTADTGSDKLDRTILPIVEPQRQTYKELDARNAKAPERWEVKAPEGAPNVVVVLIDDIGFGASAAFGGPINMPNLDKVAATGLKYNRFHTT